MALKQARAVGAAIAQLPIAVAETVERVLESSEVLVYTFIGVGVILILAELMEGVGILIKESGHIGYVLAVVVDKIVDGILGFVRKLMRFFHSHVHVPEIDLADELIEFKSSNTRLICSELASYTAMLFVFPRMSWSRHVCPVLRYFTGTPIDTILGPLIGWASYDSAPEGNNCHKPAHLTICIVCEFYLFLRLVALALVIVLIAAPAWPLVSDLIDIAYHLVLLAFDLTFDTCHWLARLLHRLNWLRKKI
jgi:hypothetical protein